MPFVRRSMPVLLCRTAAALALAAAGAPRAAEAQRWFSTDIVAPQVSQGALCLAPQRLDFADVMVLRSAPRAARRV